jgi:hypothetical protein
MRGKTDGITNAREGYNKKGTRGKGDVMFHVLSIRMLLSAAVNLLIHSPLLRGCLLLSYCIVTVAILYPVLYRRA